MRIHDAFVCDVTVGPDGKKEPAGCRGAVLGAFVALGGYIAAVNTAIAAGPAFGLILAIAATSSAVMATKYPRRGRRHAIWLRDEGIREQFVLARTRRTPWNEVVGVIVEADRGLIETTGEPILVDASVRGWRRLLRVIAQRLGHEAPSGIGDAELEALLGLPFGTTVRAPGLVPTLSVISAVVLIAAGIANAWRGDGGLAWLLLYLALFALLGGLAVPTAVTVTSSGLKQHTRLGLTALVAWDSVCGTDQSNGRITIITDQGRIRLGRANPERLQLADGIDRLLAAREQGLAPPRLEHLSDAALSPAREVDVETTIDRGLSRSDSA